MRPRNWRVDLTRRKFSREFKTEAVRLVTDRGVAVSQAARDLDLSESVLRRWMRELSAAPAAAFPGNGQMRANLAENAALKKEVVRLRAEPDILKKATALFAREATQDSPPLPSGPSAACRTSHLRKQKRSFDATAAQLAPRPTGRAVSRRSLRQS
ncbi:transposase [Paracoccus hibiscisoli]|uniref:Transposase n=1 Tax=Paracoccus hibiscisoli TaxID=2023261 RepID=A0A4U0QG27_9RHOB|nr:transposase [Paracoccus hibiscisoli]